MISPKIVEDDEVSAEEPNTEAIVLTVVKMLETSVLEDTLETASLTSAILPNKLLVDAVSAAVPTKPLMVLTVDRIVVTFPTSA